MGKHISVTEECWMGCSREGVTAPYKHLSETENTEAQQSPLSFTRSPVFQAENL